MPAEEVTREDSFCRYGSGCAGHDQECEIRAGSGLGRPTLHPILWSFPLSMALTRVNLWSS